MKHTAGLDQNRMRSQQEILDRILQAITRGDQGDEVNEYMRQAKFIPLALRSVYDETTELDWQDYESNKTISATAKQFLPIFEQHVRRVHGARITRSIAHYRAWKWLLGHTDADTFMVADCPVTGHFHLTPIAIYKRLMDQILSGEWDRLTKGTTNENEHATEVTSTANAHAHARRTTGSRSVEAAVA